MLSETGWKSGKILKFFGHISHCLTNFRQNSSVQLVAPSASSEDKINAAIADARARQTWRNKNGNAFSSVEAPPLMHHYDIFRSGAERTVTEKW